MVPSLPLLFFESLLFTKEPKKKIAENLDLVENSFIRGSTEAAVRGCSSIDTQENNRDGALC